jgi:hypothetical protein
LQHAVKVARRPHEDSSPHVELDLAGQVREARVVAQLAKARAQSLGGKRRLDDLVDRAHA